MVDDQYVRSLSLSLYRSDFREIKKQRERTEEELTVYTIQTLFVLFFFLIFPGARVFVPTGTSTARDIENMNLNNDPVRTRREEEEAEDVEKKERERERIVCIQ